jgi:hypothetical protein
MIADSSRSLRRPSTCIIPASIVSLFCYPSSPGCCCSGRKATVKLRSGAEPEKMVDKILNQNKRRCLLLMLILITQKRRSTYTLRIARRRLRSSYVYNHKGPDALSRRPPTAAEAERWREEESRHEQELEVFYRRGIG